MSIAIEARPSVFQKKAVNGVDLLTGLVLCVLGGLVFAGGAGPGGLPWDGPLDTFVKSMTSNVALAFGAIGFVGAAARLLWGGELGELGKGFLMAILAVSAMMFAVKFITVLFGVSGALI